MKKTAILAMAFVLSACMLTACRRGPASETAKPTVTNATQPTTMHTTPSTVPSTAPATHATVPSSTTEHTRGTDETMHSSVTETTTTTNNGRSRQSVGRRG